MCVRASLELLICERYPVFLWRALPLLDAVIVKSTGQDHWRLLVEMLGKRIQTGKVGGYTQK